jgi:predicted RNase H-like nuclease
MMTRYLGFDGFRGGWVMAWIEDEGRHGFTYSANIAELMTGSFKRAMIDIPIGLPDAGYRQCDVDGRKVARASVFLGARRDLLDFKTFEQANKSYWAKKQPGISLEMWNIRNKIAEVDDLVTPRLQRKVGEAHPEVFFLSRNKGAALARKKTDEGRAQRTKILKKLGFICIDMMLDQRRGTGIGRDDLIDACACAIVARDMTSGRLLGGSERDARGLKMQIHY